MLEAILTSKQLFEGPRREPPTVFIASMCARKRGITTGAWSWVLPGAGQRLLLPPDVAGWDDKRWLDTNTTLGRWRAVVRATRTTPRCGSDDYPGRDGGAGAREGAHVLGQPGARPPGIAALNTFAQQAISSTAQPWQRAQRQNALRQLIAGSPDYQSS